MGQANSSNNSSKGNSGKVPCCCGHKIRNRLVCMRSLVNIQSHQDDSKNVKASIKDITSESHFKRILSKLNEMRLSGVLNDVTINCKGNKLDCHSFVLVANSKYFENALAGLTKASTVSIKEDEFEFEIVEKLLEYMYTGKIIFPKEDIELFIEAATKWNISTFLSSRKLNLAHYWNSLSYSNIFTQHFSAEEIESKQCIIEPASFIDSVGKRFSEIYEKGFPEFDISILSDSCDGNSLSQFKSHAHRALLSSFSDYFSVLLCSSTFQESSQSIIKLENVDEQILSTIFEFLYSGKITLDYERAKLLAITVGWLCRDSCLFEIIEQFLINEISSSTCIELTYFSSIHSLDKLNRCAHSVAFKDFSNVIMKNSFIKLPKDIMEFYLSSDDLCVLEECDVFQAFLSWAIANKFYHINHILPKILRFPLMDSQQLRYCKTLLECVRSENHYRSIGFQCENFDFNEEIENSMRHSIDLRLQNSGSKPRKESAFLLNYEYQKLMVYKFEMDDENEDIDYIDAVWLKRNKLFGLQHICASMPLKKFSAFGNVGFNGKLFLTGGKYEKELKTLAVSTFTYIFNPVESHYLNNGPLLVIGRYGHMMLVVHGCVYIIGGYDKNGYFVKSIEKYKLAEDMWVIETNLLTDSMNICCSGLNEKIYVFCVTHDSLTMHCYSTLICNWLQATLLSLLPEDMINNYQLYKAITFKSKIYVFGRVDDDKTVISCYDTLNDVWMPNFPGNIDKTELLPFVMNNKLMILSSILDEEGLLCSDTAKKGNLADIDALVLQDKHLPFNLDQQQVALKKSNTSGKKRRSKYNLILDEDTVEKNLPTIVVLPMYTKKRTYSYCCNVERHVVVNRKNYRSY